jgi:hypothetical protein
MVYTGPDIKEKTLISFLKINSLSDPRPAGSALTIDALNTDNFDALVFGERRDNTWMVGSTHYLRSTEPEKAIETKTGEVIMIASPSYEDYRKNGRYYMALYRNGVGFSARFLTSLPTWTAGNTQVLFGCRHILNGEVRGYLDATILKAEIHSKGLKPEEIKEIYENEESLKTPPPPPEEPPLPYP